MLNKSINKRRSLGLGLFLGKHTEDEVGFFPRFERRGHDEVLAWRQPVSRAHLAQVDEGLGTSAGRVAEEKLLLQVNALATAGLRNNKTKRKKKTLVRTECSFTLDS